MDNLTVVRSEANEQKQVPELMLGQYWILESLSSGKLGLTFYQLRRRHAFNEEVLDSHVRGLKREQLVNVKEEKVTLTERGRELLRTRPSL